MRVRSGLPADHGAAVDVYVASATARRGEPPPHEHVERVRTRFEIPDVFLVVAGDDFDSCSVIGIASGMAGRADDGMGEVIPGLCHLSLVFVRPEQWGRGVGRELVDAALTEARNRDYDRIQLWTHEDNERAQRLYTGRGFRRDGRTMDDDQGQLIGLWVREL